MIKNKFQFMGTSPKGKYMYLMDATQPYHETLYPGGWGDKNRERGDAALILVVDYMGSKEIEHPNITPYLPQSVKTFEVETNKDGHYRCTMLTFPIVEDTAAMKLLEVAYLITKENGVITSGKLVRKTLKGIEDAYAEDVVYDDLFTDKLVLDVLVTRNSEKARNILFKNYLNVTYNQHNDRDHKQELHARRDAYEYVKVLLQGMLYYWKQDNKVAAQLIAETLEHYTIL